MTCDNCGIHFDAGIRPDGLPHGVGFVTDGGTITLCTDCLMTIDEMDDAERNAFFQRLTGDK